MHAWYTTIATSRQAVIIHHVYLNELLYLLIIFFYQFSPKQYKVIIGLKGAYHLWIISFHCLLLFLTLWRQQQLLIEHGIMVYSCFHVFLLLHKHVLPQHTRWKNKKSASTNNNVNETNTSFQLLPKKNTHHHCIYTSFVLEETWVLETCGSHLTNIYYFQKLCCSALN